MPASSWQAECTIEKGGVGEGVGLQGQRYSDHLRSTAVMQAKVERRKQ